MRLHETTRDYMRTYLYGLLQIYDASYGMGHNSLTSTPYVPVYIYIYIYIYIKLYSSSVKMHCCDVYIT